MPRLNRKYVDFDFREDCGFLDLAFAQVLSQRQRAVSASQSGPAPQGASSAGAGPRSHCVALSGERCNRAGPARSSGGLALILPLDLEILAQRPRDVLPPPANLYQSAPFFDSKPETDRGRPAHRRATRPWSDAGRRAALGMDGRCSPYLGVGFSAARRRQCALIGSDVPGPRRHLGPGDSAPAQKRRAPPAAALTSSISFGSVAIRWRSAANFPRTSWPFRTSTSKSCAKQAGKAN